MSRGNDDLVMCPAVKPTGHSLNRNSQLKHSPRHNYHRLIRTISLPAAHPQGSREFPKASLSRQYYLSAPHLQDIKFTQMHICIMGRVVQNPRGAEHCKANLLGHFIIKHLDAGMSYKYIRLGLYVTVLIIIPVRLHSLITLWTNVLKRIRIEDGMNGELGSGTLRRCRL